MDPDQFPLSAFEVDCDGSACASVSRHGPAAGLHVHPPQYGTAVARVVVRKGERIRYEKAQGIIGLVMFEEVSGA